MSVRIMAQVWERSRQGGSHLLMLLAIADFADDAGRAYPSVAALATKCRMQPRSANKLIAALRDSGELSIQIAQGPKGTNLYIIRPPVHSDTLSADARPPVHLDTQPLSARTDEPSVNHQEPSTDKRARKAARFDPVDYLVSQGVDSQTVGDWLTLRKSKRAAVTKTAIAGIEREAAKAGLSLAAAFAVCCERGWAGFRADWLDGDSRAAAPGYRSAAQMHADTIAGLTALPSRPAPAERDITAEATRLL